MQIQILLIHADPDPQTWYDRQYSTIPELFSWENLKNTEKKMWMYRYPIERLFLLTGSWISKKKANFHSRYGVPNNTVPYKLQVRKFSVLPLYVKGNTHCWPAVLHIWTAGSFCVPENNSRIRFRIGKTHLGCELRPFGSREGKKMFRNPTKNRAKH